MNTAFNRVFMGRRESGYANASPDPAMTIVVVIQLDPSLF